MINTHWGGVVENNDFGTHEFMDLCAQLGCEPYVCGNVGSGTVQEMSQWVEYMTFGGKSPMSDLREANGRHEPWKLKYFGVGNENWGCGGRMTAEYYADLYRRYGLYARSYGDNQLSRIACGPSNDDYHWTDVLMEKAGHDALRGGKPFMEGLALHYYTTVKRLPDGTRVGSATEFDEAAVDRDRRPRGCSWTSWCAGTRRSWTSTTRRRRSPSWSTSGAPGTPSSPGTHPRFLYQQNTMRDAIVAATHFDIFNRHCDRVRMANIAQTVNVLQAMILTDKEKMLLTPSYHAFEMYSVHQDATMVPVDVQSERYEHAGYSVPAVSASASVDAAGKLHITASNANPGKDIPLKVFARGLKAGRVSGRLLQAAAMTTHNTFDKPDAVRPKDWSGAKATAEGLEMTLPKMSVVAIEVS